MNIAWLLLLGTSLVSPGAAALTLQRRDAPAVVALNIGRKDVDDPVARDRLRRRNEQIVRQGLDNEVWSPEICLVKVLLQSLIN